MFSSRSLVIRPPRMTVWPLRAETVVWASVRGICGERMTLPLASVTIGNAGRIGADRRFFGIDLHDDRAVGAGARRDLQNEADVDVAERSARPTAAWSRRR